MSTLYKKTQDRRQNIQSLIENNIYSSLGVDITQIDDYPPDMKLNPFDFEQGLTVYYSRKPIVSTVCKDMILKTGSTLDLRWARPSNDPDWFLIGPVSEGRKYNFTSNLLDTRLLGIPRNFFFVDPLQKSYVNSAIHQNLGMPDYFLDTVEEKLYITTGGDATISIGLGYGSTDLSRLRPQHFDGVSKLISIPLYERIIAIRDQVGISTADFSMNSEFLKSKYQKVQEDTTAWLKSIRPHVILKA